MSLVRSRKWFGTVWEEEDIEIIKKLKYSYLIISALDQTEELHEGRMREHWHVFIQFSSNRTHPKTKTAHWEIPKHINGAVQYCKDKGVPLFEQGVLQLNQADKADWDGFVKVIQTTPKEQLMTGQFSKYLARYPKFADDVYNLSHKPKVMEGEMKHLWIWGDAAGGKTSWVWKHCGHDLYDKGVSKWWDNYKGERYVLIDDWDPTFKFMAHHMKKWADRYPFSAEVKNSRKFIRPEIIIVTSNYDISDCFDKTDIPAIQRRFIPVHTDDLHKLCMDEAGIPHFGGCSHTTKYSQILDHVGNTGSYAAEYDVSEAGLFDFMPTQ